MTIWLKKEGKWELYRNPSDDELRARSITIGERATIGEGATIGERATIGEWATIGEGATIGEWATIGEGARIGEGATIGERATIGEWATIGEGATIGEWATIGEGARIGERATIGEWATIGEGARIGGGAKIKYTPLYIVGSKYIVNQTDENYTLKIGCEIHSIEEWKKEIKNIAKEREEENLLPEYMLYIDLAEKLKKQSRENE